MLMQDIRFGVRSLAKAPAFTVVAVAVIALAVGVNAVVFSAVNGLLLRPLPLPEPQRVVSVEEMRDSRQFGVAFPNYLDLRSRNAVLQEVALYMEDRFNLSGAGQAEEVMACGGTEGLFNVLGVPPALGRTFRHEDDLPSSNRVVVIGYDLWQTHFGADRAAVGRTIMLNARPYEIIGVMPRGFKFPQLSQIWLPLRIDPAQAKRTDHYLDGIARLKPGVSVGQAQAQLASIFARIQQDNPDAREAQSIQVEPLHTTLTSDSRARMLTLLAAVALVLLIACANVTNLLLVRATARRREMAIRAAIGATRTRLIAQLMVESLLLAGTGALAGILLSTWGLGALLRLVPVELPYWVSFELDARVIAFLVGITGFFGLMAGAAPAWQASSVNLGVLNAGSRGSGTRQARRLRDALVVGEMALSLMLLIGAGLLIRSFVALMRVNTGFDPANVLTFAYALPSAKYGQWGDKPNPRVIEFERELLRQLATIPGVESAAANTTPPLAGGWGRSLTVEGAPLLTVRDAPAVNHGVISPGYFRTMRIPLLKGRDFTGQDTDQRRVTIVDKALADHYWPGQDPIGKRIRFGPPEDNEPWHEVVGVVGVTYNRDLLRPGRWNVYIPDAENGPYGNTVLVRTQGDPMRLLPAVRARVAALDPDIPLRRVKTMETIVGESVWPQRFMTTLLVVFAAIALLLAVVGLYGVISYSVGQRLQEMGIRLALGARPRDLLRLVMRDGLALTTLGIAIGIAAALAGTRAMVTLLFGVSATDALTFAAVSLILLAVAVLATYLPARRATRVDPMVALRYE